MQNVHLTRRYRPMALAMVVAAASIGLTACGGSSSSSNKSAAADADVNPTLDKAFNCTESAEQNKRVICIGSADDLSDNAVQTSLLEALADAQTGDTFILPQGRYFFDNTIEFNGSVDNVDVSNLTFRGAGIDKTIINTNAASADGFLFNNTDNLILEDFGIYESNNNALKIKNSDGIIIRRLATVWETDYQVTNGAYGIYPVETNNVLIEDSFVKGSADAGIYVGQSENIVVRNNIAEKNVAGIEIENSKNADVYGNIARGNTGGILIFDLPINNGIYGSGVRVFNNEVTANNAPNFAKTSSFEGGVHIVPPGTGIIVLSTTEVEIYNNTITDHQTTSIAVTSYILADEGVVSVPNGNVGGADPDAPAVMNYGDIHPRAVVFMDGWDPLVRNINIHDNTISVADGINNPQGSLIEEIIGGYEQFHNIFPDVANGKATVPHILYDGLGELLANVGAMNDIANGINQVAAAVKANIPGAADFTPIDVTLFAGYPVDGGVCQSNNRINDVDLFAASVFETTPDTGTFGAGGPLSKLEQLESNLTIAWKVFADPTGEMSCASGWTGTAATVSFNDELFGCDADDVELAACAL